MDSDEDLTFADLAKKKGFKKKEEKPAPEAKGKRETIAELYYDEDFGYQSKARTYQMAHARDARITRNDVEDWFRENGVAQKPRSFKNSYVAKYPRQEYQMDLFQMNKNSGIKDWNKICMIMVDIFTKYTTITPVEGKDAYELRKAIKRLFKKMGGDPGMLYTDQEPALKKKQVTRYLDKEDVHLIMTMTHAAVAERQIRTFKRMIADRMRERPEGERYYHNQEFLDSLTAVYNRTKHTTTGKTPIDARKPENKKEVRMKLELARRPVRHYPRLEVGDTVRTLVKKEPFSKESDPNWSKKLYKIDSIEGERISNVTDQVFYKLRPPGNKPEYLQHELLLVRKGSAAGEPGAASSG
jgi:hypothetical protein